MHRYITYEFVFILDNKLFERANCLRTENLQLSVQNEKLRSSPVSSGNGTIATDTRTSERIQQLEQKLLAQQEELTELHRRKGENSQQIIDLNVKLQEKEKLLNSKDLR